MWFVLQQYIGLVVPVTQGWRRVGVGNHIDAVLGCVCCRHTFFCFLFSGRFILSLFLIKIVLTGSSIIPRRQLHPIYYFDCDIMPFPI